MSDRIVGRLSRRRLLGASAATAASLPFWASAHTAFAAPLERPSAKPGVKDVLQQIPDHATQLMQQWTVPGMAVGVLIGDDLVYAEGFGEKSVATGKPYTPPSVQGLQSVAGALLGTAIMQLVERGKLDVDNPVTAYLPYFKIDDPRYTQITVRRLLGHTSGLPYAAPLDDALGGVPDGEFANPGGDPAHPTVEEYVRGLKGAGISLATAPGEVNSYSDLGYDILGDVVHKVSGQLFQDYCAEHFFEPLGMKSSTLVHGQVDPKRLVPAHDLDAAGKPIVRTRPTWVPRHIPSCGLRSNLHDMSRWIRMQLNGGSLGNARILKPASQAELWTTLSSWQYDPTATAGWGVILSSIDRYKTVSMYGDPLYECSLMIAPGRRIAVMALTNRTPWPDGFPTWELGYWALGALLAAA